MEFDVLTLSILILVVPASFVLSAAAGLGGSLILVPALVMALGAKEGVALAALLLAANNVAKVVVYRKTLPLAQAALIAVAVMVGAALGAGLMVQAPEHWVTIGVLIALIATFAGDFVVRRGVSKDASIQAPARKAWAGLLAFTSGATSGFSGTSGPLKGVALRSLSLDRQYLVGAASLVSLVGDMTKAAVFTQSGLLGQSHLMLAAVLVPVMALCTLAGRSLNQQVGEKGFAILFWTVMAGYGVRLVTAYW
ncbi:MAG: sulfite exporter TauE/SafE family protein [Pseudomonadota bacterium]|nr:sulfite exporter TauE/SafE family protein [Pseudomonadota bacterium]